MSKLPEQQLSELANLTYDIALSKLAKHNETIQNIEAEIAKHREAPSEQAMSGMSIIQRTGYFHKWIAWRDNQIKMLNFKLAHARAQREAILNETKVAFGRREAAQKISQKRLDDLREIRDKKIKREQGMDL